ncbi:hypothetical protein [Salinibacter ruber]|jgi:hypothetical protein|uniref:hypothetical protein n=1 Tax=Salinibacter ruber TaxID=146919 RepID=UPI002073AB18|nr:hypothetical protein [Salinibacter ruber]
MNFSRNNSIRNVKFLAVLLVSSLILLGCDSTGLQSERDNSQVLQEVEQFRSTYSSSLDHVGDHLEEAGTSLGNREAVKAGFQEFVQQKFGADSQTYVKATRAFEKSDQGPASGPRTLGDESSSLSGLPETVQGIVRNAQEASRESKSYAAYKEHLREVQQTVLDRDWSKNEKEQALAYLVVMEETMGFLKSNKHLVKQTNGATVNGSPIVASSEEEIWWESWGKCAAGIIGGAGTTGIAGAKAGLEIGTAAGSPLKGAAIGATVGAVSGAAAGAAATC